MEWSKDQINAMLAASSMSVGVYLSLIYKTGTKCDSYVFLPLT